MSAFGFDYILVETVGAGQADVAIRELVDHVVVLLMPDSGDAVQFSKAGIMEIASCFALNKCDLAGADATEAQLRGAIGDDRPIWRISSIRDAGIDAVTDWALGLPVGPAASQEAGNVFRANQPSSLTSPVWRVITCPSLWSKKRSSWRCARSGMSSFTSVSEKKLGGLPLSMLSSSISKKIVSPATSSVSALMIGLSSGNGLGPTSTIFSRPSVATNSCVMTAPAEVMSLPPCTAPGVEVINLDHTFKKHIEAAVETAFGEK